MAEKHSQDGSDKIRQSIARLQARLRKKEAVARTQERKVQDRRKIIIGASTLEHMTKNKESIFTKTVYTLLDEYVTRTADRELLNEHFEAVGLQLLAPLEKSPANDTAEGGTVETALQAWQK